MRSLKLGIVSLSLVGAVFAAPQAAYAVASFEIDTMAVIQARTTGPLASGAEDGSYSGAASVSSHSRISSLPGFGTGDAIGGNAGLGSYVSTLTGVGATSASVSNTFNYVRPAYLGVPTAGTPFAFAGTQNAFSGSASAGAGAAGLDAGIENINVGASFTNHHGSKTRTIDLAFMYMADILALVDDSSLEGVATDVSFVVESRTRAAGAAAFGDWSTLYSADYTYDPSEGEFGLGTDGAETFFYTMNLAALNTMEFNFKIQQQGSAFSNPEVAASVPVPAALPLLGLGLVGWRRRDA